MPNLSDIKRMSNDDDDLAKEKERRRKEFFTVGTRIFEKLRIFPRCGRSQNRKQAEGKLRDWKKRRITSFPVRRHKDWRLQTKVWVAVQRTAIIRRPMQEASGESPSSLPIPHSLYQLTRGIRSQVDDSLFSVQQKARLHWRQGRSSGVRG